MDLIAAKENICAVINHWNPLRRFHDRVLYAIIMVIYEEISLFCWRSKRFENSEQRRNFSKITALLLTRTLLYAKRDTEQTERKFYKNIAAKYKILVNRLQFGNEKFLNHVSCNKMRETKI